MDDLSEYLDLYLQTGKEYVQSLNASLLVLEKNPTDKTAIEDVFRNAHSLKSQSAAMGFEKTGFLCHTVEDVFYEIKNDRLTLRPELADLLFSAFDSLGASLANIEKSSQELDLSAQAEALKQLSGVTTTGAGKTQRTEAAVASNTSEPSNLPAAPETPPSPQAAAAPPSPPAAPAAQPTGQAPITTIAVKVAVLDEMMNLLENLLVERLRLKKIITMFDTAGVDHADLTDYINVSEKILADMQYQIMKARAVPVSLVFDHFPRAVRDLGRAENKQVELVVNGADLELDRTIVDRLDEPLIHLIRNAVSHGIARHGTITLTAERQKDYAQITVADDGQGVDWQAVAQKAGLPGTETNGKVLRDALFSGISTSKTVTQISGRGVGLRAIKQMVDNFGGTIDVQSEHGKGTAFIIKLPLTLAIAKALVFAVGGQTLAIPTLVVRRIVTVPAAEVTKMADQEVVMLDDLEVPLVHLDTLLGTLKGTQQLEGGQPVQDDLLVIVIDGTGGLLGVVVDSVQDAIDIVIKPVPDALKGVSGFSGATILGNGKTALVINPQELL